MIISLGVAIGTVMVLGACLSWAAAPYEDIPARRWTWDEIERLPDGPQRIERELLRQGEYGRRWRLVHDLLGDQHVSRRGSLRVPKSLGDGEAVPGATAASPDTLSVLIIRIAFETNRDPQLTTIDPSGEFVLEAEDPPPVLPVDPPPRDKAFYESHLAGLSEYYRFQSGDRLYIEGRVLPDGDEDSYKLSDVADYGPGASGFWTLEGLERLVRDMISKADEETQRDGSVNLADFGDGAPGTYIIFVHAGSDWQSDINGDSPNDIPTFFVALGEPEGLIGTGPDGEAGRLSECSIIPETTNQDGYPGSIAAAFYHEFGHALGLPDVYSTGNGLPAAGIWDLMDSGTNLPVTIGTITDEGDTVIISPTGVLPPSLSVWAKDFLGWVEAEELDGTKDTYRLPAVGVLREQYGQYRRIADFDLDDPQVYRAGASRRDYFLLENRWVPFSVAETPFDDLRFERDEATGVIQYLAGQRFDEWSNSGIYDYFLPSGGILVWHVNGDRVASFLEDNALNWLGDGLRLVEADGIQDIGVINAYVLGWFGSWRDPFGGRNLDGIETDYRDLYTDGFPSSRGYDRSWTGLHLSDISSYSRGSSAVMKFEGGVEPLRRATPREMVSMSAEEATPFGGTAGPRRLDLRSLTPLLIGDDTQPVLVYADRPRKGWSGTGYPGHFYYIWYDGRLIWNELPDAPPGAFETFDGTLVGAPALRSRSDGDFELAWAVDNGTVAVTLIPNWGNPQRAWTTDVGAPLIDGPVPFTFGGDHRWLVAAGSDRLLLFDTSGDRVGGELDLSGLSGQPVTSVSLQLLPGGAGREERVAVLADEGWFLVRQNSQGLLADIEYTPYDRVPAHVPEWTGSREGDPGLELHVFDMDGELGAWWIDDDGEVARADLLDTEGGPVTPPAVADLDGDGADDFIIATDKRIYAFKDEGIAVRGFPVRVADLFPLPDSTRVSGPVTVADGDGDGRNEIYFATDGGHLLGVDATGRLLPKMPFRFGDRVGSALAVGGSDEERVLWLASEGGTTGPPRDRNDFNGRVSAYGLAPVSPAAERSSEWHGLAGDAYRRGPAGERRHLGAAAPIAQEEDRVVFYPNPLTGDGVNVRFFSSSSREVDVAIYNLEGELVRRQQLRPTAGAVNDHHIPLPGIASGIYLARISFEGPRGPEVRTLTLAVEK